MDVNSKVKSNDLNKQVEKISQSSQNLLDKQTNQFEIKLAELLREIEDLKYSLSAAQLEAKGKRFIDDENQSLRDMLGARI